MDASIYALNAKSTAQQRYAQERVAALAQARRRRTSPQEADTLLERTVSGTSVLSAKNPSTYHSRNNSISYGDMDSARLPTTSSSNSSQSEIAHQNLLSNPYELRHERRYLREVPYPLPVDLAELQRQGLRTMLSCKVFDSAVCSPEVKNAIPERVLEVGCGSGFWSATCHDYFSSLGSANVSFTGLDVAPLSPDLARQGVNWTFVQHDIRRIPLPFDDEQFNLVMLKDVSLVLAMGPPSQKLIDECIRILQPGGTLEIWESDHVNPYLQQANAWIQEALDRRKLPSTPCARISDILHQEPDSLVNVGSRRIAIPLGDLRWERDGTKHSQYANEKHDSVQPKGKDKVIDKALTADQAALRQSALLTVLQMIESLEPLLKEVNGKNAEEWAAWWSGMMGQLLDPSKGALTGECLEIGAWWATKVGN